MSSLRHILIGLAVLAALGAAAGWVYRQRVEAVPSIPFLRPILTDEDLAEVHRRWEQRHTGPLP